jgi:hypothetical protein
LLEDIDFGVEGGKLFMDVVEMGIAVVVLGDEVFVVEVFGLFFVGFLMVVGSFGLVCAHYIRLLIMFGFCLINDSDLN